jgi:hypothetical protein
MQWLITKKKTSGDLLGEIYEEYIEVIYLSPHAPNISPPVLRD